MAIYHLSAKMVSRAKGQSVVASAAYRSAENLHDQRIGQSFDYTRKQGIEYSEILAPEKVPEWVHDRERLWNEVELAERRKDAQLAREIEIALPVELTREQQIALVRDFAQRSFVAKGMVVDLALHVDNPQNPHAHLLLTTRDITENGFGLKRRDWNAKAELLAWRQQWAEIGNEHLARAGLDLYIDHRTLEAQGVYLVAGRKLGLSAERQKQPDLPRNLAERVVEQRGIAAENGRRILEDPRLALKALTHQQATFTERDVARFLNTRTDGAEQFTSAHMKVMTFPELVKLGQDEHGRDRFTSREMLEIERSMLERAERLAENHQHTVSADHQTQVLAGSRLSTQQREAFEHVTGQSDLAVLVGVAGTGKSTMLESARHAWEAAGYSIKGAALAGIAAQNLETASGIQARTLASWERSWENGRELLGRRDVLVIDEAGLIGTRQLARVLESAEKAGAKVVLVGDPEQLQAIEAGAPFRGIAAQVGMVELTEVRRQRHSWQKEATKQLATGRTFEALTAYERAQQVHAASTREAARGAMLAAWERAGHKHPGESRLMLAYTRDDVRQLNDLARASRQAAGEIGKGGAMIETEQGPREFAAGDRLYFLRNEHSLSVKNGSLGTVEKIRNGVLQVRLDGEEARRVVVDTRFYPHLDHGYAATVHKAQSATVDRTYVLATPHFDRHATYVALTRHREGAEVFYGQEDFRAGRQPSAQENFKVALSRARSKKLAHDYLERAPFGERSTEHLMEQKSVTPTPAMTAAERLQQRSDLVAQRLAAEREQERAREALEQHHAPEQQQDKALEREIAKQRELDHDQGLEL